MGAGGATGRSSVGANWLSCDEGDASVRMSWVSSVGVRTMSSALVMSVGAAGSMCAGVGNVLGSSGLS